MTKIKPYLSSRWCGILIVFLVPFHGMSAEKHYTFHGTINQKIPVELSMSSSNDTYEGYIRYVKNKKNHPIHLIGSRMYGSIRLLEMDANGNISGIITIDPVTLKATWFSPKTRVEWPLALTPFANTEKTHNYLKPAQRSRLCGHYHYQYGPDGYIGDIDVYKNNLGNLYFIISSVTADPARNMADLEGAIILNKNNTFVYAIPHTPCSIRGTFYDGFLRLSYLDNYEEGVCGFGHNATVEGIFKKISNKKLPQCREYTISGDSTISKHCTFAKQSLSQAYQSLINQEWSSGLGFERYLLNTLPNKNTQINHDQMNINYTFTGTKKLVLDFELTSGSTATSRWTLIQTDDGTEVEYDMYGN